MKHAFVTGAGGFLGRHVVAELQAHGLRVSALAHSPDSAAWLRGQGIETLQGELTDHALLSRALSTRPDMVFHLAASTSLWRAERHQQQHINVEGTSALLNAAMQAGIPRLVYTSSISVYGLVDQVPINESMPRLGRHGPIHYAQTKAEAEARVLAAAQAGRIQAAVLQPAHLLGPGDRHNWSRLARMIAAGRLPGAPPGRGCFADVREVASAHLRAALHPAAARCWVLGGVEADFMELCVEFAKAINVAPPRWRLPSGVLYLHAWLAESRAAIRNREPEITREGVAISCHRMRVDDRRAREELGYQHTPLRNLAAATVSWLRASNTLS